MIGVEQVLLFWVFMDESEVQMLVIVDLDFMKSYWFEDVFGVWWYLVWKNVKGFIQSG